MTGVQTCALPIFCSSHFTYKTCSTIYSQSLNTEGKWRYDEKVNGWVTTPDSAYDYTDPYSALEAIAKQHYNATYIDGDGNAIALTYLSYAIQGACSSANSVCGAHVTYKRCNTTSGTCSNITDAYQITARIGDCSKWKIGRAHV